MGRYKRSTKGFHNPFLKYLPCYITVFHDHPEFQDMAKERIPKKFWSKTPVLLKATAGLRLLSTDKVQNLSNFTLFKIATNVVVTMDNVNVKIINIQKWWKHFAWMEQ